MDGNNQIVSQFALFPLCSLSALSLSLYSKHISTDMCVYVCVLFIKISHVVLDLLSRVTIASWYVKKERGRSENIVNQNKNVMKWIMSL